MSYSLILVLINQRHSSDRNSESKYLGPHTWGRPSKSLEIAYGKCLLLINYYFWLNKLLIILFIVSANPPPVDKIPVNAVTDRR